MSSPTLFCCVDAPADLPPRLAAEFPDCRVVASTTRQSAATCLEQLGPGAVAVAIAPQSWLGTPELQTLCDRFPDALVVVLDPVTPGGEQPGADGAGPIYRRLTYPGTEAEPRFAELLFTVSAALAYYRQGQQLAAGQVALAEAHRQLDNLQRRMSALMVQLDWGLASASDRVQTEQALRHSQSSLAEAQRIAHLGSWEFDLASQTITWSTELFRIYGLDPASSKPSYDQWRQAIPPEDWPPLEAAMGQAIAAGIPFEVEHRIARPDGSVRYIVGRGEVVYNDQGQVVQLRGTGQDRTEAKLAELALEQAEERYRRATQAARTGVWELDLATYTGYLDPTIKTLAGHCAADIGDSLDQWLALIHPDDRDRLDGAIQTHLRGETEEFVFEYRMPHRDGSMLWVLSRGQLRRNAQGQPTTFVGTTTDITPLKQVELALKQLNEALEQRVQQRTQALQTLATVVENSTDLIGTASLDGAALYLNPAGQRLMGLEHNPLAGRSIKSFLSAATLSLFEREAMPTLMAEGVWRGESVFCHVQTGAEIAVEQVMFLVRDPGTYTPLRIATICRDIRDRKRAELAIKTSEARFRATFEQAAVGMVQTDVTGRLVKVNQTFCDLLGYAPAELEGKSYADITHPADVAEDRTNVERLLAGTATQFTMEKRYLRRDRTVVWANLAVALVRDGADRPQYFIAVVNDITQRKQAQLDLRESRNMLKLVLDTIPQRVFWKDRQSRFLGCNPAFAGDYGLTPDQVIGNTDLELPWAAYGDRYRADDAAVMASKTPRLGYEEPSHAADGKPIWIRTSKIPLTNTGDEVIGVLGCYEDISDRKQVEESLRQLNAELEQRVQERTWELEQAVQISEAANRAKSTFLANMSHELRTPLNAILGFAQLVARDSSLSGDHRQALDIINRSGEHLLMLINDILEMAKIEAGQVSLNAVCFDLDTLLTTLGDMLSLRAQDKGLRLTIERHPALPQYLVVDEPKLRQVLINLLGNAIKFTSAGDVTLRVAPASPPASLLTAPPPGSTLAVTFAVADTGIGIAAADCDRLFEPFVQIGQGAGTGLGLSISRQFVQMLGGDIAVESQPGQGATFTFTLTLPVAEGADCAPTLPTSPVTGLAPGQPSYRILVVDDDDTHRHLLRQVLQSLGFAVQEAANGQAALDLWPHWQPQMIWLDMRMPVLSGPETARAIRAQERGKAGEPTKIIALTANAFEDDRARALALGCDDFVCKPFQIDQLLAKLAEHLGVEYAYGPSSPIPDPNASQPLTTAGAIALLSALPAPLLNDLHRATVRLDGDQLAQLLPQIPTAQGPLVDWLTRQIDDFAFDILHTLLEQAQGQSGSA